MRKSRIFLLSSILYLFWFASSLPAFAGMGRIVFSMPFGKKSDIFVIDEDGRNLKNLTNHPANDINGIWSPDGTKIAFASDRDGNYEIYVMNADGQETTRLTNNPQKDSSPSWSPDGKQIAFARGRFIYVMSADGGSERRLTEWGAEPACSPDGKKIAFYGKEGLEFEITIIDVDGGNRVPLTNRPGFYNHSPAWSPDGSQIAFVSENRNNRAGISMFEIYLMNADGSRQRKLTPNEDFLMETSPTWTPDGSQIAFLQPDGIYLIQTDGKRQRKIFNFLVQAGFGGLSWFDPSFTRNVNPSGKMISKWGHIKEAPSH